MMSLRGQKPDTPRHMRLPDTSRQGQVRGRRAISHYIEIASTLAFARAGNDICKIMKPRWQKVFHDLIDNKGRTLLVVFSIAVGVFSIGVIVGAYQIISNDMSISYSANHPANIELRMSNFDEDILASIRNQNEVQDAEARRVFNIRVRVPGTENWTTLDMTALDDFQKNTN